MTAPYKPIAEMNEAELIEALKNPHWRLRNLYWVKDKDGNAVRFRPWSEQEAFLENIWYRNVIPKARQRGFSTVVQLLMLDACIFVDNTGSAVIAQDLPTATKIFRNKIKFAWQRMPKLIHELNPLVKKTETEYEWSNGSSLYVATSTRGDTPNYLHVSELGIIGVKNPLHATEIQEGALQAVPTYGVIVVESTVEGAEGLFPDLVRKAQQVAEEGRELKPLEYRLHFASWWTADEYEIDPAGITITKEDQQYFREIEAKIGVTLSDRKRAWWVQRRDNDFLGEDQKMWSQYPSTLDEAFRTANEGLWLSKQMALVRSQGRIRKLPYDPNVPVDTWWDLGGADDMVIWFSQQDGPWTNFINYLEGSGEGYSYYWREMNALGYTWGRHYLPHDGDQKRPGAEQLQTPRDILEGLGMRKIEIVPRISEISAGIDQLRSAMSSYRFDEENTAPGIKHLDGFAKQWSKTQGRFISEIYKNGHQHAADAIRQEAQYRHIRRNEGGPNRPTRRRKGGMAA